MEEMKMSGSSLGKPHELYGYLVEPPPYPPHLVQDLIVKEGTYGMVSGEGSSAKSLVVQALMVSLASGEKFGMHFTVNGEPRRVMFVDLDQGADTSLRRFAKLVNWPGWENEDKEELAGRIFHYSPIMFSMFEQTYVTDLQKALIENEIDVLVIDCLARTLGGEDENSSSTADAYFKLVKGLQKNAEQHGRTLTVIIIHHQRKAVIQQGGGKIPPAQDNMRGASAWRDSLDFQYHCWKKNDLVGISCLKDRNSEHSGDRKWTFRIYDREDDAGDVVGVRFEYEPDAVEKNTGDVLWSVLSQLTEGRQDKAVGIKTLSEYLKVNMVKGCPHSTVGIKPFLFWLIEAKRAQCSNQNYRARDPHKTFWNVA